MKIERFISWSNAGKVFSRFGFRCLKEESQWVFRKLQPFGSGWVRGGMLFPLWCLWPNQLSFIEHCRSNYPHLLPILNKLYNYEHYIFYIFIAHFLSGFKMKVHGVYIKIFHNSSLLEFLFLSRSLEYKKSFKHCS